MADSPAPAARELRLPDQLVTRSDVGRLMQEAEAVSNFLSQATVRQPGTAVTLPKTSQLFEEMVSINQLNLLQQADREYLSKFLLAVRTSAPVLHVSFNTDPSALFQQRLISWLRQQIHPFVLVQIGLRPSIGAGCVVRTTNKFYDFSLRHRFDEQHELLVSKLRGEPEPAPAAVVQEPANAS